VIIALADVSQVAFQPHLSLMGLRDAKGAGPRMGFQAQRRPPEPGLQAVVSDPALEGGGSTRNSQGNWFRCEDQFDLAVGPGVQLARFLYETIRSWG